MPVPIIKLSELIPEDLSKFSEVELLRGVLEILSQRADLNHFDRERLKIVNNEFRRRESVQTSGDNISPCE
jgi:hypothetical protein